MCGVKADIFRGEAKVIAERTGKAAGREMLPKGKEWEGTAVPSPETVRSAASNRPRNRAKRE